MRELKKIIVFLSLVLLTIVLQAESDDYQRIDSSAPPENFSAITLRLQKVKQFSAEFEQRKHLKVLSQPFLSKGRIAFIRERGIFWQIVSPLKAAYIINESGIKSINSDIDSPLPPSSPINENISKIFSSIIGGDIEALSAIFEVYFAEHEKGWRIMLKPKDPQIAKMISAITLIGDDYINKIKISEQSGDFTNIAFVVLDLSESSISASELDVFSD